MESWVDIWDFTNVNIHTGRRKNEKEGRGNKIKWNMKEEECRKEKGIKKKIK